MNEPILDKGFFEQSPQELSLVDTISGQTPQRAARSAERSCVRFVSNFLADESEYFLDVVFQSGSQIGFGRSGG
jgi:hypothetical protein